MGKAGDLNNGKFQITKFELPGSYCILFGTIVA